MAGAFEVALAELETMDAKAFVAGDADDDTDGPNEGFEGGFPNEKGALEAAGRAGESFGAPGGADGEAKEKGAGEGAEEPNPPNPPNFGADGG